MRNFPPVFESSHSIENFTPNFLTSLLRLTHSIPQSALFSTPIPAISAHQFLWFKTRKRRKIIKCFYDFCCRIYIFYKKVVHTQLLWLNIFKSSISLFVLIKVKTISKTRMKRYAETGSCCQVPISRLKYSWLNLFFLVWTC